MENDGNHKIWQWETKSFNFFHIRVDLYFKKISISEKLRELTKEKVKKKKYNCKIVNIWAGKMT